MESSIHLCWSSEAELDELQLMGEGLKRGKKKLGQNERKHLEKQRWKNSKQKSEELTRVWRAKQRMSEKQLKVFQGGKKFQTVMQEKNTQTNHYFGNYANV